MFGLDPDDYPNLSEYMKAIGKAATEHGWTTEYPDEGEMKEAHEIRWVMFPFEKIWCLQYRTDSGWHKGPMDLP